MVSEHASSHLLLLLSLDWYASPGGAWLLARYRASAGPMLARQQSASTKWLLEDDHSNLSNLQPPLINNTLLFANITMPCK